MNGERRMLWNVISSSSHPTDDENTSFHEENFYAIDLFGKAQ